MQQNHARIAPHQGMPDNLREALDRLAITSGKLRTASEILADQPYRPPSKSWTPWWADR